MVEAEHARVLIVVAFALTKIGPNFGISAGTANCIAACIARGLPVRIEPERAT